MIWESSYWKEPLLKWADYLEKSSGFKCITEKSYAKIERSIFFGFFTIRKLADTKKISEETKCTKLPIPWIKNIKEVNYWSRYDFDILYDFEKESYEDRDILFISNRFIHSYIFCLSKCEPDFYGVYVASDNDKNSKCYAITICDIVKIFRLVGNDYPSLTVTEMKDWHTHK